MTELRKDIITGEWVIIAVERGNRPKSTNCHLAINNSGQSNVSECPFCYGNENRTPPEILAYRLQGKPNSPGWEVRVVPNQYAALKPSKGVNIIKTGIFESISGTGNHEVLIESPRHNGTLGSYPLEHIIKVIKILKERYLDLKNDAWVKYIQIFKNYGAAAGASQTHPHFQLIAGPVVPQKIAGLWAGAGEFYRKNLNCVFCEIIEQEKKLDQRLVEFNKNFAAICPFASRFPGEVWIIPTIHQPDFSLLNDEQLRDLAGILKNIMGKLEVAFENPPYNLVLYTMPTAGGEEVYCHWYIAIMPRITTLAGFELGTGIYINLMSPELACQTLQK